MYRRRREDFLQGKSSTKFTYEEGSLMVWGGISTEAHIIILFAVYSEDCVPVSGWYRDSKDKLATTYSRTQYYRNSHDVPDWIPSSDGLH